MRCSAELVVRLHHSVDMSYANSSAWTKSRSGEVINEDERSDTNLVSLVSVPDTSEKGDFLEKKTPIN